ncbi:A-kinase anchor protein 7 isoforms alpha and beta-like isoform X1 [Rhinoderma darwinii]|uniref:A-kinase anchor protein 7 isoforms alpha and beta-like isoform X1 n=1 Tax=Rhinoderma darwinii TaxID=43563 RepID=UPI003F676186
MGQLCCFPFSRGDEKIIFWQLLSINRCRQGHKNGRELDDAELVSLSKRLVENAVLKAVQQYIEETQTKTRQTDGISVEPGNKEKTENNLKQ